MLPPEKQGLAVTPMEVHRGIAQSGSAPALGAGCREFESLYPDHYSIFIFPISHFPLSLALVQVNTADRALLL